MFRVFPFLLQYHLSSLVSLSVHKAVLVWRTQDWIYQAFLDLVLSLAEASVSDIYSTEYLHHDMKTVSPLPLS